MIGDSTPFSLMLATISSTIDYLNDLPKTVVGYKLNNTEQGKWNQVCVLFNGGDESQNVKVDRCV